MPAGSSSPGSGAEPVRTCVGCRGRHPVSALLRIVAGDGTLVPDPRRRMPGRGAWLHPDPACLDLAERRRAFGRALRATGTLDSSTVRQFLAAPRADGAVEQGPDRTPADRTRTRKQVDPS